jgi:acetoin utilization deacetylase AcuC-like enzyme
MEVTAQGFAYMTRTLVRLAEEVCHGRLLLTLEGGYNLDGQRDGILAVLGELSGQALDTGYPTNLDAATFARLNREKSSHPAILQAWEVAKKRWKM